MSTCCVQSLEPRLLLAVAFNNASLSGSYALMGPSLEGIGSIRFDGAGLITAGSLRGDGFAAKIFGGTYSVALDGSFTASIRYTDGAKNTLRIAGALRATLDLAVISDLNKVSLATELNGAAVLVKRPDAATNADLAGTWEGFGSDGRALVSFDGNGKITGGSIRVSDFAEDIDIVIGEGRYIVTAAGSISGSTTVEAFGEEREITFSGVLNRRKDIVTVELNGDPSIDFNATVQFTRPATGLDNADLIGSWRLVGDGSVGVINFNGKGRITGGAYEQSEGPFIASDIIGTISGTYLVDDDGRIEGKMTIASSVLATRTVQYKGSMNRGANFISFNAGEDAPESPLTGTSFLIRPDARFAALSGGTLTVRGTEGADITGLSVRSGSLNITQHGVTQKLLASNVAAISVSMLGGNDSVALGGGVIGTTIDGGAGKDSLTGGSGGDSLIGGLGNDSLVGGAGNDTLYGAGGNDRLLAGVGDDLLRVRDNLAENADGGDGDDRAQSDLIDLLLSVETLIA